jgi:hypothetical protein
MQAVKPAVQEKAKKSMENKTMKKIAKAVSTLRAKKTKKIFNFQKHIALHQENAEIKRERNQSERSQRKPS